MSILLIVFKVIATLILFFLGFVSELIKLPKLFEKYLEATDDAKLDDYSCFFWVGVFVYTIVYGGLITLIWL